MNTMKEEYLFIFNKLYDINVYFKKLKSVMTISSIMYEPSTKSPILNSFRI